MTGDPRDPIIEAFSNPLFLAAYDELTAGAPHPLILDDLESSFPPGTEAPPAPERGEPGERRERPGDKLHELLGDVLKAEAGNRHDPLTRLALYYAHRLHGPDDLRTTLLGFIEERAYADMTEGDPSEFDKIVSSAWDKARAYRSRSRQEDIADTMRDDGPPPLDGPDPNELAQPP